MYANRQTVKLSPCPSLPTQEGALRNNVSVLGRVADAVSDARSDPEVSGHWGPSS